MDCSVPWITLSDVKRFRDDHVREIRETDEKISIAGLANSSAELLPKGTVILSRTASVGFSAVMGADMATTQDFANWVCGSRLVPEYLWYCLKAMRPEFRKLVMGSTHKTIYMPDINALKVALPDHAMQRSVVEFLDRETARIDTLIVKQKQLVELLKEKRQAVISRAVTKGLDADVPMKDSGADWMGTVPAHWECSRVGWTCQVGNGSTPNRSVLSYWTDGVMPWLNSASVNNDPVVQPDRSVSHEALAECALPVVSPGSVLLAITGEGKTRGTPAVLPFRATISQHVAFLRPITTRLDQDFLKYWLTSIYRRVRDESDGWGSTKAAITCADIRRYPLPFPSLAEQKDIARHLRNVLTAVEEATTRCREAVKLLEERRAALVSAAVTGQIHVTVRDLASHAAADTVSAA